MEKMVCEGARTWNCGCDDALILYVPLVDIAQLMKQASPLSEMQSRLLEDQLRIQRLIDSPAIRLAKECAAHQRNLIELHRRTHLTFAQADAQRLRELLAPSRWFAEQQSLAAQRMAALAQWKNPVDELTRRLAELQGVESVFQRLNEAASTRIQALQKAITNATDLSRYSQRTSDVGAIVRDAEGRISAALKPWLRLAAMDYSAVAGGFDTYVAKLWVGNEMLDTTFTRIPERELFVTADVFAGNVGKVISRFDLEVDPKRIRSGIDLYVYETLDEALSDFAPDLMPALNGARQIAVSQNPEKTRYACVSLRTVSLGVFELLAPTEKVKEWSPRPRDFFNGRPRTIARLRFISQHIDSPELSKFMEADSRAICALIDVLHSGTHEFAFEMNLRQLRYLFRRIESFLCAILEATVAA